MIKRGHRTPKGNHLFVEKIRDFSYLIEVLSNDASIYIGNKIYSCAFVRNWTFDTLEKHIKTGEAWTIEKIDRQAIQTKRMRAALNS